MRKTRRGRRAAILILAAATFGAAAVRADGESGGSTAVVEDSAEREIWRKSFQKRKFPWYSSADDSVVFLPPRPETERIPRIPRTEPKNESTFDFRNIAETVFWTLFVSLILALLGAICWTLAKTARDARGRKKPEIERKNRERRLEALAPEAREQVDDLGTAAENALAAGDLRLALVYFFSWLIVESDKRGLLRARRGKTNREYWLELAGNPGVRTIYKATMDAFERVYFGGQTISRAEFDDVWRLREPFREITAEIDAKRRANEARNAAVSRIWALPLATAALGIVASGCRGEPTYWDEARFAAYGGSWFGKDESINGASVFAEYCARKTRGVDRKGGMKVDGERYETIVWFYPEKGVELYSAEEKTSAPPSTTAPAVSGETVVFAEPDSGWEESDPFADRPDSGWEESDPFADESETDVERKEETQKSQKTLSASTQRVAFSDLALEDARPAIESWLREKPNRTFVFVPDGWRADVDYWRAVREKAPSERVAWVASRLNAAEETRRKPNVWLRSPEPGNRFKTKRLNEIKREKKEFWAAWEPLGEGKRRERFSGVDAWTAGLPATTDVWASRTMTPDGESGTEVLLSVDGDPFVCRRRVGESDFFALESAAFLLNFALTKPENRVLAGRLADEFAPNGKTLFWFGSELAFDGDDAEPVSPFSLARLTPFSLAVWHWAALAAILVAWRFPILGRPKRNAREATNDYAKHVDGVAFLLEKANADDWARKELETFRAAREAGAAFREPLADDAEKNGVDGGESPATAKKSVSNGRGASRKFFRR